MQGQKSSQTLNAHHQRQKGAAGVLHLRWTRGRLEHHNAVIRARFDASLEVAAMHAMSGRVGHGVELETK